MSTLQGKYLRDTYKDLLQISNSNIGVDDTARYIEDGEGTPSILAISTSNVGVGTDTPAYTLDVAGDINLTGSLKVNGADAVFSNWTVNGADVYRSAGNVGIGTDSPGNMLEINAGTGTNVGMTLRMGSGANGYNDSFISFENSQGSELFRTRFDNDSANERYVISSDQGGDILTVSRSGNVGIGTTNPGAKLDVYGDWKFRQAGAVHTFESYSYGAQLNMENITVGGWARANRIKTSDTSGAVYFGALGGNTTLSKAYWTITDPATDPTGHLTSNGIFLLKNGNVGIGTTNPGSKLTIFNTGAASVDAITLEWEHLTPTTGLEQRIKWRFGDDATPDALTDAGYIAMGKDAWNTGASRSSYISFATVDGINQIQYGGTEPDYTPVERMRISKEGNVGIGTAAPDHQLTIKSSLNHGCVRLMTDASTDNHIRYDYPSDSSKYWLVGADQSGNLADSFIVFNAPRSNVDLFIDQATGNVSIGTTTPPNVKFSVVGSLQAIYGYRTTTNPDHDLMTLHSNVGGTSVVKFKVEADGDVWSSSSTYSSDVRLKTQIDELKHGVDTLNQLQPKQYKMIGSESKGFKYGFVAQEIETVLPDLIRDVQVNNDEDGVYKALDYNSIIAVLTKAVQEQQTTIDELKSRIQSLEKQ